MPFSLYPNSVVKNLSEEPPLFDSLAGRNRQSLFRKICKLPLFRNFQEFEIKPLLAEFQFRSYPHRGELFRADQKANQFALVVDGTFKLIKKTPNGDDAIVYFATSGDPIGAVVMSRKNQRHPVTSIAMGPASAILIPRSVYLESWLPNAKIQARLNDQLFTRMSFLQDDKANSALPLQKRIAWLFLKLMDQHSEIMDTKIPQPITRQEIADAVCATVEAVIRCMSEMSKLGLVRTVDKNIEILRPDLIAKLLKAN